MSTSEIISYEGRRFARTGEIRPPKDKEWYMCRSCAIAHPLQNHVMQYPPPATILRELPAETPAATDDLRNIVGQFMLVRGIRMGDMIEAGRVQDLIEEWAGREQCILLAEAEEALQAFADWGEECDNPRPSEAEIERQFQLFAKCRAVLARIRAAKEKP